MEANLGQLNNNNNVNNNNNNNVNNNGITGFTGLHDTEYLKQYIHWKVSLEIIPIKLWTNHWYHTTTGPLKLYMYMYTLNVPINYSCYSVLDKWVYLGCTYKNNLKGLAKRAGVMYWTAAGSYREQQ